MRFSTVAVAGFAITAQAAVPKRGLKDLFSGDFTCPDGISITKEDLVGPWDAPGDDDIDVYHPSHEGVVIDHCDKKHDKDWHWVHPGKDDKDDEYHWVTETITATETVVDCDPEVPCDGGKTVTVTIPKTTTICPTPNEPPVDKPTEKPEPPVESPPVEPPVHPTPSPEPPKPEPPMPEPPVTSHMPPPPPPPPEVPESPIQPPPEESSPVYPPPPPETPVMPPPSEPVPPPPEETQEIPTSVGTITPPSQTSEGLGEGPTAAAVPNAQRAGGALIAAAIAAALL